MDSVLKDQGIPNFDLLRAAYEVIKDSPDEEINLDTWVCGTQFCAAGKLTQAKKFRDLGLRLERDRRFFDDDLTYFHLVFRTSEDADPSYSFNALSKLFNFPRTCYDLIARELFDSVKTNEQIEDYVDWSACTDRQIFLSRMRLFFTKHNQVLV